MFVSTVFAIILASVVHVATHDCDRGHKNANSPETRLREDLMCYYDKDLMHTQNGSEALNITMGMVLVSYFISDQHVSEMHTSNRIIVTWIDKFLTWKPDDYESLEEIKLTTDKIWTPEITPVETEFLTEKPSILESTECKVSSVGNVTCVTTHSHYGFCKNDLSRWPHDVFTCRIQYKLWVQHGETVKLVPANHGYVTIMPDASTNNEVLNQSIAVWTSILDKYLTLHEISYAFELQHIEPTYHLGFIIPAVVLSIMSLMAFWVSTQKNDRLLLISLNLVAHIYQIESSKWQISVTAGAVPFILRFYRDSFIMVALGLFETLILRKIVSSEIATPRWMLALDRVTDQRVLRRLLLLDLLEIQEMADEEQGSIVREMKLFNRKNQMEKNQIAQIVDRLLFVISFMVYFVLLLILMTY